MVRLSARDYFDAGGQFFPWVMAMSVGGCCLDIDSFDQSNDEASSVPARMMVGENRGRATVTGELSPLPVAAASNEPWPRPDTGSDGLLGSTRNQLRTDDCPTGAAHQLVRVLPTGTCCRLPSAPPALHRPAAQA